MMAEDVVRGVLKDAIRDQILKKNLGKGFIAIRLEQGCKMRLDSQLDSIGQPHVSAQQRHPAGNRGERCQRQYQCQKERVGHDAVGSHAAAQHDGGDNKPHRKTCHNAGKHHLTAGAGLDLSGQRRHMLRPAGGEPGLGNGLFNKPGHALLLAQPAPERQARVIA